MKERVFYLTAIILLILSNIFVTKTVQKTDFVTKIDTITIRDTIINKIPIPTIKYIDRKISHTDTIYKNTFIKPNFKNTLINFKRDTAYFTKRYEYTYQTDKYKAVISGYAPKLESMELYRDTKIINKVYKPKKWNFILYGGYGICGKETGLQIGVGVGYTLFKF